MVSPVTCFSAPLKPSLAVAHRIRAIARRLHVEERDPPDHLAPLPRRLPEMYRVLTERRP
jgi:hypothetical protein